MKFYSVTWTLDVEADSHEDAARKARAVLLDPESIANMFNVRALTPQAPDYFIDVDELEGRV